MTIVGTTSEPSRSRYTPNASAWGPSPKYATHPDESTTVRSVSVVAITVCRLPVDALRNTTQLADGAGRIEAQSTILKVEKEFLARLKAHLFADSLGDHYLIFRGHFDFSHRGLHSCTPVLVSIDISYSITLSIASWYSNNSGL